jgi:hypothetical protein
MNTGSISYLDDVGHEVRQLLVEFNPQLVPLDLNLERLHFPVRPLQIVLRVVGEGKQRHQSDLNPNHSNRRRRKRGTPNPGEALARGGEARVEGDLGFGGRGLP